MVNEINDLEFDSKINVKGKVIVDCYADWCGPCRMLAPIMEEVASEIKECSFYKINVDNALNVPNKFGIMSIPTILFFEDGNLKEQIVGFRSKDELINIIRK